MRQSVAKRIKRECYGDNASTPSARKYTRNNDTGAIEADPTRQRYQRMKKEHNNAMR
jgi:hypothetical protein